MNAMGVQIYSSIKTGKTINKTNTLQHTKKKVDSVEIANKKMEALNRRYNSLDRIEIRYQLKRGKGIIRAARRKNRKID